MADKVKADEVKIEDLDITDELIAERNDFDPGKTPDDMMPWMRPIVAWIDILNLWVGRLACLLTIPLIGMIVYEVVSRTSFGFLSSLGMDGLARNLGLGPTLWVYEFSRMGAGVFFMLGAGYALMRGVHIRADFLYRKWSKENQMTVDSILYLLFYFPAMTFFLWVSYEFTAKAWVSWERAMDTTMMAPLAPARTAMPIAAFLLLLQGVSEFLKSLYAMSAPRRRLFLYVLPVYIVVFGLIFIGTIYPKTIPLGTWWYELVGALGLSGLAPEFIGLVMIAVMLFSIFVGFPISFTLIFLGFVFGTWGFKVKLAFYLQTFQFNSTMLDDQLVAVPLFVFMGILMEKAGLMERLFRAIQMMFSSTRGALFVAVLFVSMIFAAATGIVGASVTILGIMAAKTMNKSGYDVRLAAGTITAGGTLGILIPPSIMLVVMGPVLEVPVTTLFQAAIVPGIMLAFLYMAYALVRCWINPSLGPVLPEDERPETSANFFTEACVASFMLVVFIWLVAKGFYGTLGAMFFPGAGLIIPLLWLWGAWYFYNWSRRVKPGGFYMSDLWMEFFLGLVPPTILIAFALGSILLGFATPAEAAACGGFGAIVLTLAYRKFTWGGFYDALIKTLEITVLIMFLVAASNFFGAVFSRLGTPTMLTEFLLSMDLSAAVVIIVIMGLIFLLGWPLEWVPIVLIIVPILVPTIEALELTHPLLASREMLLTWFAILVAVNLQTAWLSPPVALSAYFLKGVVPEWDLKDIYIGMMQFMLIQLLGLVLIFLFPKIVLWLPMMLAN